MIKLKHQLLLLWLGSIVLVLALSAGVFTALLTRFHEDNAKAGVQEAFVSLHQALEERQAALLARAEQLSRHEEIVGALNFFNGYENIEDYDPLIFDHAKQDLAKIMAEQARGAKLELLAALDKNQRLSSFYCQPAGGKGYVAYDEDGNEVIYRFETGQDPQEIYQPPGLESLPATIPPGGKAGLAVTLENVIIIVDIPVYREHLDGRREVAGMLRLGDDLDANFVAHMAHHAGGYFKFGLRGGPVVGHMPGVSLDKLDNRMPRLSGNAHQLADLPGWWQPQPHFFIGAVYMPLLYTPEQLILVAGLNKAVLENEIAATRRMVLIMLLLMGALLVPVGNWFLRRTIACPLEQLVKGVRTLAEGKFTRVNICRNGAELTALAEAFNTMSTTLAQREENLRKLSTAVEQSPASVMITDAQGNIEYVNACFTRVTGYTADEVLGKQTSFLKSGYMSQSFYRELWQTVLAGNQWRGEIYNRKKDGTFVWESMLISPLTNRAGEIIHFLTLKEDITPRKEYEAQLVRQAHYDTLTCLPNRLLAWDRLQQALAAAHRTDGQVAVMLIDLDRFKDINDTLGHAAGDQLLVEVTARLRDQLEEDDTLARLGGDEFLVVLPGIDSPGHTEHIARHLLQQLTAPFYLEQREIFISASIGLTLAPNDGHEVPVMMRNADAAMYQAKDAGRNTYRFFTPAMNIQALSRLELESQLRRALERGELSLYYQAQREVRSGRLIGAEALLRWHNPKLGNVPPSRFIPLAEATNLIGEIGAWVLHTACTDAIRWHRDYGLPLQVAVNVSPCQFRCSDFVADTAHILRATGLPPQALELEVTESLLVEKGTGNGALLRKLKALGVKLALDDFGTGYSSLLYLKRFPFDVLKIDRSFIHDLTHNPDSAVLTIAIINLAHSLGLKVVAEGVENAEHVVFLEKYRCDVLQGYHVSKPMKLADFEQEVLATALEVGEM